MSFALAGVQHDLIPPRLACRTLRKWRPSALEPGRVAEAICSRIRLKLVHGKLPLSRNDYFYILHRNADGRETTARKFRNKETALSALAAEVGENLNFVGDDVRSSSHTLKRFANVAGRPGELLEGFLVTTEDWVATDWRRKKL